MTKSTPWPMAGEALENGLCSNLGQLRYPGNLDAARCAATRRVHAWANLVATIGCAISPEL